MNNLADCQLDGGDCCRRSCILNCDYKGANSAPAQLPLLGLTTLCPNTCGSRDYDCKQATPGCSECYHGTCKDISTCYKSSQSVKQQLDTCRFDSYTQGNYRTVDMFCGRDVQSTFVHDPYNQVRAYIGAALPGVWAAACKLHIFELLFRGNC